MDALPVEPVTVTLSRPIRRADGIETHQIQFRPPTMRDLRQAGDVFIALGDGAVKQDLDSIATLIANLGGIPLPNLDAMSPRDFNACRVAVLGFLGDSEPESS